MVGPLSWKSVIVPGDKKLLSLIFQKNEQKYSFITAGAWTNLYMCHGGKCSLCIVPISCRQPSF